MIADLNGQWTQEVENYLKPHIKHEFKSNLKYYVGVVENRLKKKAQELFNEINRFALQDLKQEIPRFSLTLKNITALKDTRLLLALFMQNTYEIYLTFAENDECSIMEDPILGGLCHPTRLLGASVHSLWKVDNCFLFPPAQPSPFPRPFKADPAKHLGVYWQMAQEGNLTDMVFQVGERRFSAHKLILMSHSDYFRKMLHDTPMKESRQDEINIEASPAAFGYVLEFLYKGDLPQELTNNLNLMHEIWMLAAQYQIPKLLNCLQNLIYTYVEFKGLCEKNFSDVVQIAILFHEPAGCNLAPLKKCCFQYAEKNDEAMALLLSLLNASNFAEIAAFAKANKFEKIEKQLLEKAVEMIDGQRKIINDSAFAAVS